MTKPAKSPGRDVSEFRSTHDKNFIVPKSIEEGLKALGPDKWEYNEEFRKLCGVSTTDLSLFREQFAEFWLEAGSKTKKIVWCGSKGLATKLKGML